MSAEIAREVQFYNPQAHGYRLADDPRCLYGWGPPARDCRHMFGHMCCREVGHPGLCDDSTGYNPDACMKARRPKDWDAKGRAEANR